MENFEVFCWTNTREGLFFIFIFLITLACDTSSSVCDVFSCVYDVFSCACNTLSRRCSLTCRDRDLHFLVCKPLFID